jgi:hypothetical protein
MYAAILTFPLSGKRSQKKSHAKDNHGVLVEPKSMRRKHHVRDSEEFDLSGADGGDTELAPDSGCHDGAENLYGV